MWQVEEDGRIRRAGQPGILCQFALQLPGGPTGIPEGNQVLGGPALVGNCEKYILGGGEAQFAEIKSGLEVVSGWMQDKAAISLHRTAAHYPQVLAVLCRTVVRAQLLKYIGQVQAAGLIDDQPHGALCIVVDQVNQRLRKVRIIHLRHGNQEVMLEIAGFECLHAASFGGCAASRKRWLDEEAVAGVALLPVGGLLAGQPVAAVKAPGADDFKTIEFAQVAGEGGIGSSQSNNAKRCLVENRLAG